MPHAFFIGSKMATMRRLDPSQYESTEDLENEDDDIESKIDSSIGRTPSNGRNPIRRTSWAAATSNNGPTLHLPQPMSLGSFNITVARSPKTVASPVLNSEERRSQDSCSNVTNESSAAPMDCIATSSPPIDLSSSPSNSFEKPLTPLTSARQSFKPTLACVQAHLPHAQADVAGSLLGFAILINSSILILAAAVFYYGNGKASAPDGVSDLFDAYDLVKAYIGPGKLTDSNSWICDSIIFHLESIC
jgi:metal iron transporter